MCTQLVSLYKFSGPELTFAQYRRVHEKIALTMRPDIEKDELEFLVKEDYDLDSSEGPITPERLRRILFDMVDVWTTSTGKEEYLGLIRDLREKLNKAL